MVYPTENTAVKNTWITSVRNEHEYQMALIRVGELANAVPNSKEEHEREWLALIVEDYIAKHIPFEGD